MADSIAYQQSGNYTKMTVTGVSNFTSKSFEITVLKVSVLDIVAYIMLIHRGSYCFCRSVTAMAYCVPVNTTALSESMVSGLAEGRMFGNSLSANVCGFVTGHILFFP